MFMTFYLCYAHELEITHNLVSFHPIIITPLNKLHIREDACQFILIIHGKDLWDYLSVFA